MAERKKFDVLSGLRLIFKFTNLYNKNGFHIKYNKYGDSVKIPDFCVFCLIVLPSFYSALLYMWAFVESNFDLELTSVSVAWAIGATQMALTFIWLAMKNDLIVSTVDHLQKVVETSKCI